MATSRDDEILNVCIIKTLNPFFDLHSKPKNYYYFFEIVYCAYSALCLKSNKKREEKIIVMIF